MTALDKVNGCEQIMMQASKGLEVLKSIDPSVFKLYWFSHHNLCISGLESNEEDLLNALYLKIKSLGGTHIAWRSMPYIETDQNKTSVTARFSLYGCPQ